MDHSKGFAIIVPLVTDEFALIEKSQRFWTGENVPFLEGETSEDVTLIYAMSSAESPQLQSEFLEIIKRTGIEEFFAEVRLEFLEIDPDYDYYIRKQKGFPPTEEGFVAGPNRAFLAIATSIGPVFEWCFLMELDCIPLRPGWGTRMIAEVEKCPSAWVVGSQYHGWSYLDPLINQHLNGNAFYHFGDQEFQRFIEEVWKSVMATLVHWGYPGLAYDCVPALMRSLVKGPHASAELREMASQLYGRYLESPFVLNLTGTEDKREDYESIEVLLEKHSLTSLFHAGWLMKELDLFTEKPRLSARSMPIRALMPPRSGYCIRNVFCGKGAWFYAGQFVLRRFASTVIFDVLIDSEGIESISVEVEGCSEVQLNVKRWKETTPSKFSLLSWIFSVFSLLGLRRRHPSQWKAAFRFWCERTSQASRTDLFRALRISLREWRGRKIARGLNHVKVPSSSLKRASGITVFLSSTASERIEGKLRFDVHYRP